MSSHSAYGANPYHSTPKSFVPSSFRQSIFSPMLIFPLPPGTCKRKKEADRKQQRRYTNHHPLQLCTGISQRGTIECKNSVQVIILFRNRTSSILPVGILKAHVWFLYTNIRTEFNLGHWLLGTKSFKTCFQRDNALTLRGFHTRMLSTIETGWSAVQLGGKDGE